MCKEWKKYLLWFAHEHVDFRITEIESLLSLFSINIRYKEKPQNADPFWIVELESENDSKLLASRSVTLRWCIELWSHEKSAKNLHKYLRSQSHVLSSKLETSRSFKLEVETFCKHFTQKEKIEKIEEFSYLPVKGSVDLANPDIHLQYIEYYGTKANAPPEEPYDVFFGRRVASGHRQLIKKLSLKNRKFIGNTSMDAQLSLLMANQAKVQNGDIVLDPFVGSGSLLVAAAAFGGYVIGSDINYLMLHGRTKPSRINQKKREVDENIKSNMKQYNLESRYLDILVNDFAMVIWRECVEFDAIITDPPYGIREATEKVGTLKNNHTVSEEHLATHIPAKVEYGISNIYRDLLIFSAQRLKIGGRMICWFPVYREDYVESCLPNHPCLKLVANSEQVLNKATSRRLLTYEKIEHPSNEQKQSEDSLIHDFREKYFEVREVTRKERRTKEAEIRRECHLQYKNKQKQIDS